MRAQARHDCPICGREAPARGGHPGNPAFPFCSPACKLADLGRWLDGSYRIPGPPLESMSDLEDDAPRRPDGDGE
jgi:endogenous inhibitor of DNA gyrase (YacG/DUF329 family)